MSLGIKASAQNSAGGGGYTASAVHFGGAASLDRAAIACTDNGLFSAVYWFKIPASANDFDILWAAITPNSGYAYSNIRLSGGTFFPSCAFNEGAFVFDCDTSALAFDVWHSIILSCDTNKTAGNKLAKVYIDDVAAVLTRTDAGAAFSSAMNGAPFHIGDDGFGDPPVIMDFAEARFLPGVSLLDGSNDIPEATRRLFVSASNKPVDPAIATAALGFAGAMLFSGDASTFGTNQGTGGAFTLTGSLTNASSSPSD